MDGGFHTGGHCGGRQPDFQSLASKVSLTPPTSFPSMADYKDGEDSEEEEEERVGSWRNNNRVRSDTTIRAAEPVDEVKTCL